MASKVCRVLVTVADSFVEQGKPLEAIKCLQAVLISGKAEYPQLEADIRLKVAKLLWKHTYNAQDACKALDRANWLLSKLRGCHSLKCAVIAKLVECHKHLGLLKQLIPLCENGLKISQDGMKIATEQEFVKWALHFQVELSEAHSAQDTPAALGYLESAIGLAKASSLPAEVALLHLGVLQLHIQDGNAKEVLEATQKAAEAIIGLESREEEVPTEPHLKLHFEVLRAAWLLSLGEVVQLQQKDPSTDGTSNSAIPATILQLQQLAKEAIESLALYPVLPPKVLPALAEVIAAAIWRPTGKFSKARAHLAAAQAYLCKAENASGISLADGEAKLQVPLRMIARQLAWIQSLILEHLAGIAITKKELNTGAETIGRLIALAERFPSLLGPQKGTIHLLAGNYCAEVGEPQAALKHFMHALEHSPNAQERRVAAAAAALCLLSQPDNSQGVPRAMEILKQHQIFCPASGAHPPPESSVGHYASALVLLRQGHFNEGRTHIMKALKIAHAPLHNHQLVAKIMIALVPTYMEDDLPAVQSMTNTALSLSKGLYDLPIQISAAQYTLEWMGKTGLAEKVPEQEQYIKRKQDLLKEAQGQAKAKSLQHAAVVDWGSKHGALHSGSRKRMAES